MFKKIVSSMILLMCAISLYAASIDLGKVSPVTVSGTKISEGYVNSGASVVVITADDIEKLHAQSTSQVLETVSSVSLSNYGYMGSLQNVDIRGVGSRRTEVYLNGASTSMAYDSIFSEFNVDSIPVEMIERIEIITGGADKNGKSFAAGGVVNIVTKKGNGEKSFAVAFENGSFLPLKANGAKALIDSQRLVASGTGSIGDFNVAYSINHDRASNNYAYKYNDDWFARENAEMWDVGGTLNVTGNIGDWSLSSLNLASYVNAGSPGDLSNPTSRDHKYSGFVSTANTIKKDNITVTANYSFNPFYYEQYSFGAYSHTEYKAHSGSIGINSDFALSDNLSTSLFADTVFNYAKGNGLDVDFATRFVPSFGISLNGNLKGLKVYPMAKVGYATDMKKFIPEGSLGLEYDFDFGLITTADVSYAENLPTFSDLYYYDTYGASIGNPDLKTESGLSADIGVNYKNSFISYSGDAFIKSMKNKIQWNCENWVWRCCNIESAFYWGFDQTVSVKYQGFNASIGWLFNKSYDLSYGRDFSNDYAVNYARKHTLTFTAGYDFGKVSVNANAKYYGKYSYAGEIRPSSNVFVMNLGVDYKPFTNFGCYAKIDNLLNTQKQLTYDYPMPGLKLRLGANYKF